MIEAQLAHGLAALWGGAAVVWLNGQELSVVPLGGFRPAGHRQAQKRHTFAVVTYRFTLRAADGDDVGTGLRTSDEWLRVGDEFEEAGERWRIVDRLLMQEVEAMLTRC